MYDYLLGGVENYASDRAACAQLLELAPSAASVVRNSRAFLHRAVRLLADEYGVDQFLDFGFGVPTRENVHEIARGFHPDARVVYVDTDPLAITHGRTILVEDEHTAVIDADITVIDQLLEHKDIHRLISPHRPTAALFSSVLHCVPDSGDPRRLIQRVTDHLAPGSFVVLSHLVSDQPAFRDQVTELMGDLTAGQWGRCRAPHEVDAYLAGMHLLPPGLADVRDWRPDSQLSPRQDSEEWTSWGGVARA
ncbi:SAM-dependent methyltransferase [Streptomyces hainanensis]|uniref:SAM-dependent methyltransferase n=2 Tax=Streptomyces hainanensis TaxID=402648 RepID=A0A4V2Y3S1_9ACTN|nr:SAM-dependent methyltransferase [Streptomyces hainanensis]